MISVLAALLLLATAMAAPKSISTTTTAAPASTATLPPADEVTIKSVSTSGSGCPKNEVSISISDDRTAVTLGFDEFDTYFGPGVNASMRDKTCLIHLSVRYPSGYTFAVLDATYHGFAQLDDGVTGNFSSTYEFVDGGTFEPEASLANATTTTTIEGGGNYTTGDVYTKEDVIPTSELVRSPCGKIVDLLIRTRIYLTSTDPNAEGELTDDDATFAFTQEVHFGWGNCSSTSRRWNGKACSC